MLNSNYFSKRAFAQNLQVFNLWLEQQYNISCSKENNVFTKQIHFYHSYIKFLNYRQKYIEDVKKNAQKKLETNCNYLASIEKELLNTINVSTYSKRMSL